MVDVCDPDADIQNLRQLIKLNTGIEIKLTKNEMCQAYKEIQNKKLPLPPLIMTSDRTYLIDKNSPLKPADYDLLFDSGTKRVVLKRIARKVDLKNIEQMTKAQVVRAIGKRLRYMKIREPVQLARKRRISSKITTAVNNFNSTAVNNFNSTAVNNLNNTSRVNNFNNTSRVNNLNNTSRVNNFNNTSRVNNLNNTNRVNNLNNTNRVNNLNTARRNNKPSIFKQGEKPGFLRSKNDRNTSNIDKVTFPKNVFQRDMKPKFLGGNVSAVKAPTKTNKNKNFIPMNKFNREKPGYVFKQGEKGLGYYLNIGRVQGPQLPEDSGSQPIPTTQNMSTNLAIARIKKLGLRSEKKFLNKLNTTDKRNRIVREAEQALKDEDDFVKFLNSLNLKEVNKNSFINRLKGDDIKQLRVQAQLKADELSNVIRSSEDKMTMFLNTLSLNNTERRLFINRAKKEESNVNSLIEEAKTLNSTKRMERTEKKKFEFLEVLKTYNQLSPGDKQFLIEEVGEKTNVTSFRKRVEEYIARKVDDKKNMVQRNLLSFLTPLKINQSNKNTLIRKFKNDEMNVNAIRTEALKLQNKKTSTNTETLRTKLGVRLNQIGLNQLNKNTFMQKFRNGNRNVDELIEQAKQMKKTRNDEKFNKNKREYSAFLNTLPDLTTTDKISLKLNGNTNREKAKSLANIRKSEKKKNDRNSLTQYVNTLGLNITDKNTILSNYDANTLTLNALKNKANRLKDKRFEEKKIVNKESLSEYLKSTDLSNEAKSNIMTRFERNVSNLKTLKLEVNKMVKNITNTRLSRNKKNFTNYVKTTLLSQTDQDAFVRRLNTNDVNISTLRKEVDALISKMVVNQRSKNRDEIEEYIKTYNLSNQNKISILSKFDANNKITIDSLKLEVTATLDTRKREKLNTNSKSLMSHMNSSGLNATIKKTLLNKLPQENIESLKLEASRISEKMRSNAKIQKNQNINKYMNSIGLDTTNKRNIIGKNLPLNEGKKLANQTLQRKISEKQAKNRTKLNLHLSEINLTNEEKKQFFNNLDKNININTIKTKASSYASKKKRNMRSKNAQELVKFMTEQGLTQNEQAPFINKILQNKDDLLALKKEATTLMNTKLKNIRSSKRRELVEYLSSLTLNKTNIEGILKNYDTTNVNVNVLKKRGSGINGARRRELYARNEGEFLNYLNSLQELTPNNRTEISSKLDGFFTNWEAIKKKATNLAVQRGSERRNVDREELSLYMSKLGLNQTVQRGLMKNFDDNLKNKNVIRQEASTIKNQMIRNKIAANRKVFTNFLNTLSLNNSDKKTVIETYNNGTVNMNTLKQQTSALEVRRKKEKRQELFVYVTELKLDENDKKLILSNYDANPKNITNLKTKANELKISRNKEEKEKIRQELKKYINTLNMLNNNNKKTLLSNTTKSPQTIKAEANSLHTFKKTVKKESNKSTLQQSIRDLPEEKQKYLLNKFDTRNVTLNSIVSESNQIRQKLKEEKRILERKNLYDHLDALNLNVVDRNSIINKFNKANGKVNTLKNEAIKLKERRVSEKNSTNKKSLSDFLNTLNLSATNKTAILDKFNTNKNTTIFSLETNARQLEKQRKIEKRLLNRQQLIDYVSKWELNNTDTKTVLNKFNNDNSVSLIDARKVAVQLLNQRNMEKTAANRGELSTFMNTLSITNTNKSKILKSFDSKAGTFNTLKTKATNLNYQIRRKVTERKEISNYINKLGVNGTQLIKKFNNGRSTLNKLKVNAKKMRDVANAKIVESKRDDIRKYMSNTKLTNVNKKSFIERIELNTNIDIIKREVKGLNAVLKGKNDEVSRKKTELSVFLNDLNNLTSKQRTQFIKQITGPNTNVEQIKSSAESVNRTVKNKRADQERVKSQKRLEQEAITKKRDQNSLQKHLMGLNYLTNEEKVDYISNFMKNKSTLNTVINASKTKNKIIKERKTKNIEKIKIPLLNKIINSVPGTFGKWRREWETSIRKAQNVGELTRIQSLLDEKLQLRKNIENANINDGKKRGQLRFVMKKDNSIEKRRIELTKHIQNKKNRIEKELAKIKPITSTAFEPNNNVFPATNNPLFNEPKRPTLKNIGRRVVQNIKVEKLTNTLKKAADMEKKREEMIKLQGGERVVASRKLAANEGRDMGKTGENIKALFDKTVAAKKEIQSFKGAGVKNQDRFIRRINMGENVTKVLREARVRNRKGIEQMSKTKKALMAASTAKKKEIVKTENVKIAINNTVNAKNEIRSFKGAGVKNQDRFIRRINMGENVTKVLREARVRNIKGIEQMSKTKKALMAASKKK